MLVLLNSRHVEPDKYHIIGNVAVRKECSRSKFTRDPEGCFLISYDFSKSFRTDSISTIKVLQNSSVIVHADALGLNRIYYCHCRDGRIVITDELWLLAEFFGKTNLNDNSLAEILFFGFIWSEHQTILKDVHVIGGSHSLYIDGDQLYIKKTGVYPFESVEPHDCKYVEEITLNRLAMAFNSSDQYFLGLSGGKDSRLLAQILRNMGAHYELASFGGSKCGEILIAKDVAEILGKNVIRFSFSCGFLEDHCYDLLRYTHGQNSLIAAFLFALPRLVPNEGVIVTGFLGDHISGQRFAGYRSTEKKIKSNITDPLDAFIKIFNWGLTLDEIKYTHPIYVDHLSSLIEFNANDLANGDIAEKLHLLDWHKRQLKHNTAIPYILGSSGHKVLMPFCDLEIIKAWNGLERTKLVHQMLYKQILLNFLHKRLSDLVTTSGFISDSPFRSKLRASGDQFFRRVANHFFLPHVLNALEMNYIDFDDELYVSSSAIKERIQENFPQLLDSGLPVLENSTKMLILNTVLTVPNFLDYMIHRSAKRESERPANNRVKAASVSLAPVSSSSDP